MVKERLKKITTRRKKVTSKEQVPFEKKTKLEPLYVLFVIVDQGQGDFFMEGFNELEISLSLKLFGKGTAPEEMYDMLSTSVKKDIVLAVVKENDLELLTSFIETRFAVSNKAKGIAFTAKIDSLVGVLIYKFLTNSREYNIKVDTKKEKQQNGEES